MGNVICMVSPRRKHLPRLGWVGLAWLVVIDALTNFQVGPITLSGLFTLGSAALCVWYLFMLHVSNDRPRISSGVPLVLGVFLALAWVRLFFDFSIEGVQNVAVYTGFILAMSIGAWWAPAWQTITLLRALRLVSVVVPAVFIVATLTGREIYEARPFALACIIFAAALIPYQGVRLLYKIGPLLVVAAAFLSLSRTAAIITVASLVFLAVRSRSKYRVPVSVGLAASAGAGLWWAVTSYAPFRDRFLEGDQALSVGGVNVNTSGRSVLWELTWDSAMQAPLFGHGPGAANALLAGRFITAAHPHNDYLRLFHDFGLVGAGLFIIGVLLAVKRTWARARRADDQIHWVALIALLGITAAALTDNVIIYPFVMIPVGLLLGCSLAQPLPAKRRRRRRRPSRATAPHQFNPVIPTGNNFQQPKQIAR
jgi:O-antigen ligase